MLSLRCLTISLFLLSPVFADGPQDNIPEKVRRIPAEGIIVPAEKEQELRSRLNQLQLQIASVQQNKQADRTLLPDVMIFERAVRCALDYNEFFAENEFSKADGLLDEGLARCAQLLAGDPQWTRQTGLIVRGYISRIDRTVQPYGVVIPDDYDTHHTVPSRCDLWFHGRGEKLSEVNFLWDRMKNRGRFAPDHTIVLHPYGRYSNAFKFAGEIDVLEALDDVRSRYRIDDERTSVRGFSMGGAACWQFATHYADRWFAANPGAGFSETPRFLDVFQKETLNPQPWEKTLWNLYDCDKWSGNLLHCPTVAYSGENDPQKQAADVMEEALAERGIRLRHLIGPGMGHTYDPVSAAAVDAALADLAITGRPRSVPLIHLTTYSLRYNRMRSATIDGLTEHWKPAELRVSCELQTSDRGPVLRVSARNINAFRLNFKSGELPLSAVVLQNLLSNKPRPIQVSIASPDSDRAPQWLPLQGPFSDGGFELQVHQRENGQWHAGPKPAGLRKTHGLQGPIDDAFMDSFVFVRPTGKAAHDAVGKWANAELERAVEHWRRHFRGDARVVDDTDVTPEMISDCNLVLWGDPYSNSVLGKIGARLPIQWDDTAVSAGDQSWDASGHALIMIAPNPLNPDRYVVLNSSFTFRDYAYLNNARQVPMLPDWAVIDLSTAPGNIWPGKVAAADFFNEEWQLKTTTNP